MAFYNNLQSEAEEERAQQLVEEAESLADSGDFRSAIPMFKTALNIYIDIGQYIRIAEVFDTLITYVQTETDMINVIEYLKEIILTIEYLDIPEEEAHLKQVLANLAYKNSDYLNASQYFQELGDLYIRYLEPIISELRNVLRKWVKMSVRKNWY